MAGMARVLLSGSLSTHTPQANGAAEEGRLDTLEWLWERLGGNPEAVVWMNALEKAANAGQLAAVKWLLDRGCKCNEFSFLAAAGGGHVEVVALLWKRVGLGESKHAELAEWSAKSGSLPMLKWMVDHGLRLAASACSWAAQYGHLDALRFLRSYHCPWKGWTLKSAVGNGHLDTLQWALANGCPWTVEDRRKCLRLGPRHRTGIRRWIEECWHETHVF